MKQKLIVKVKVVDISAVFSSVLASPILITTPLDSASQLGEASIFTCQAIGIPTPTIHWLKEKLVVGEGSMLNISDVKQHDVSSYVCVASNNAGNVASDSVELVIFGKYVHIIKSYWVKAFRS